MRYSVPVVVTITGWIEIQADSLEAAQAQARVLNEQGVPEGDIKDSDTSSECMIDEIETLG